MTDTKQSVSDMRKRCKALVDAGDKSLKGYSKLTRSELTELMSKLDLTDNEVVEVSEPEVTAVAVAVAVEPTKKSKTKKVSIADDTEDAEPKMRKAKRAPSRWNVYCKENKIAPGSCISEEQKQAYSTYKESLLIAV